MYVFPAFLCAFRFFSSCKLKYIFNLSNVEILRWYYRYFYILARGGEGTAPYPWCFLVIATIVFGVSNLFLFFLSSGGSSNHESTSQQHKYSKNSTTTTANNNNNNSDNALFPGSSSVRRRTSPASVGSSRTSPSSLIGVVKQRPLLPEHQQRGGGGGVLKYTPQVRGVVGSCVCLCEFVLVYIFVDVSTNISKISLKIDCTGRKK